MNKVIFNTVIIEVTRRCNMSCPHCLRGDAQNVDMDLYILDRFLYNFKDGYIRELFFTGGEPTLSPDVIKKTLEFVSKYNIEVYHFGMITNGKNLSNEIINILNENHFYVDVSIDDYHDKLTDYDYSQLSKLDLVFSKTLNADDTNLFNIGRARKNNIGRLDVKYKDLCFSRYNDNLIVNSRIVCTCDGIVLRGCGFSYEDDSICKLKLCEYDDDILDILLEESKNDKFMYNLAEVPESGTRMYKFFDYLREKGVILN